MESSARKLVLSARFWEPPVAEISAAITASKSDKIILYGPPFGGKSVVLDYFELINENTLTPAINTSFSSKEVFGDGQRDCYFDERFISHFYELEMTEKIISYIRTYYRKIYEQNFWGIDKKVIGMISDTKTHMSSRLCRKMELPNKYKIGGLSFDIVSKFKRLAAIDSLSLLINGFDYTDGNSIIAQQTLSQYFNIFDKTVITSGDKELISDEVREADLSSKGYDLISVNYGENLTDVKKIVELYIESCDPIAKGSFSARLLTADLYRTLIEKAHGNIELILMAVDKIISSYQDGLKASTAINLFFGQHENGKERLLTLIPSAHGPRLYL